MAVTRAGNDIRITADNDTIIGAFKIKSITYIAGASSPSAYIKHTDTNGMVVWGTANTLSNTDVVCMDLHRGTYHFDLAGTGTEVILHLE